MKPRKIFLGAFLMLITISVYAQTDAAVYYFIDAVSDAKEKTYIYTSPIVKSTTGEVKPDQLIADFKKKIKEDYGITTFTSTVVRTNGSYEEAKNLMTSYSEKYKGQGYKIIEVSWN